MSKVILTGDRPTGRLHVGHYVGSLKRRLELQDPDRRPYNPVPPRSHSGGPSPDYLHYPSKPAVWILLSPRCLFSHRLLNYVSYLFTI